ncbi:spore coat protein [Bacillus sp. 491mf]|uniref:spore coat protein n=1 Tax=Bacillus sp. 491mf TaxID=1761755 RepID=UPI000B88477A|nr:spore coat protein [Bacillus sp. 491mf]
MATFEIGARCLFNLRNERFFLLVEDEVEVPSQGVELDPVNVYKIDEQIFNAIKNEGDVQVCVPVNALPVVPPGFELERKCIFTANNIHWAVFELENGTQELILLTITAALFNSLKNFGVRECEPQRLI